MNELIEEILHSTSKPYQYVGNEVLSAVKDWDNSAVKIALGFPDKYEVGASNLGLRILYEEINKYPQYYADRVYAPDIDFRDSLIANKIELYGLNSKQSLNRFDIVGFSIQYELFYPTVLKMLEMANIPLKSAQRDSSHPLIIAGGPCTFNPVVFSDFIDIFLIGDGEDLILELVQAYEKLKPKNLQKIELLLELAKIEGLFIPALYKCDEVPIKPLDENVPTKVKKRIAQINYENASKNCPVAYSPSIHDRAATEIRRGCGRMCRFCQPGHVTLPIRERKAADIINITKELTSNTGYDEYSLMSLSSCDYTNIKTVVEELSGYFSPKGISASLPSQRVDKFDAELAQLVQKVRKSTVTLAPEAGSQRLRDVINKNLTKEQIIKSAMECYSGGFNQIKLYFILGLPTETYQDLDELAELLAQIKESAFALKKEKNIAQNLSLTCTLSIFTPKPFTPFQWHGQISSDEAMNRIHYLKDKTKNLKGVKLNYHDKNISRLEAVFSRGGHELNEYIYKLYKNGAYLDSWDEYHDDAMWRNTAQELNLSLDELAQACYSTDSVFGWEIIDVGIEKQWLINEYQKALRGEPSVPCEVKCTNCGVCKNLKTAKVIDEKYSPILQSQKIQSDLTYKYRIKLTKIGSLKFLSHLDWQNTLMKSLYKSGLKLVFSQGFNPIPKISLGVALPIFVESECEFVDIELYDNLTEQELTNILQKKMPAGAQIKNIQKTDKSTLSIDNTVQWAKYQFELFKKVLPKNEDLLYIKDKISSDADICIEKKNKKGIVKIINVKDSIKSVDVTDGKINLVLKIGQGGDVPSIRPDVLINYFYPEALFKIKKLKMYDGALNEL